MNTQISQLHAAFILCLADHSLLPTCSRLLFLTFASACWCLRHSRTVLQ